MTPPEEHLSMITPPAAEDLPTRAASVSSPARSWPRRSVLAGSGAALLACAACGSKSTAGSGSAAATGSGNVAASGTKTDIASVSAIPAGSGLIATAPSGQVILALSDGKVVAHTAVCTHMGAIIDGSGICPLHGSKFDPSTGAVINGPATEPLAAVPVTESGGQVYSVRG